MKKVIILGAGGMLAQALEIEFAAHADAYDVHMWGLADLDITDSDEMRKKLLDEKPDVVINSSAINAVDAMETDDAVYKKAQEVNGMAVGELAKMCKELDILLVHYSSEYVFSGEEGEYSEDATPQPLSKYGETKFLGETELQKNTNAYYLIRLSRLFGKAGISEGSKKSFVDTMLWLVENQGKTELNVVDEEISSPSYAPDIARFTRELIEDSAPYGIYHAANSGACTWYELAHEAFRLKNLDVTLTPVTGDAFPRPAKRPMHAVLVNTKRGEMRDWKYALQEYLS